MSATARCAFCSSTGSATNPDRSGSRSAQSCDVGSRVRRQAWCITARPHVSHRGRHSGLADSRRPGSRRRASPASGRALEPRSRRGLEEIHDHATARCGRPARRAQNVTAQVGLDPVRDDDEAPARVPRAGARGRQRRLAEGDVDVFPVDLDRGRTVPGPGAWMPMTRSSGGLSRTALTWARSWASERGTTLIGGPHSRQCASRS
jgi:hypothetical protein